MPIVRDDADRHRFPRLLFYLNDEYRTDFWEQEVLSLPFPQRPMHWPERRPLVRLHAWILMPNHLHLLVEEIKEKGTSKFMQSLCGSMSKHFNEKYNEKGSLFQSAYKSRTVDSDPYLRYVAAYIMVKNAFELYPGGIMEAINQFEDAWNWAQSYRFSSLSNYVNDRKSPIVETSMLSGMFSSNEHFKSCAKDMILGHVKFKGRSHCVTLE